MRHLLPNVGLSVGSAVMLGLAIEGGVRLLAPQNVAFAGLFREDPVVGIRHVPSFEARMRYEEHDVLVKINSEGFRDREYPPAGNAFRVLGLGDSFAFGFGVPEEDTYLSRIEALLGDRHVEVINAGVAGMGPDNEARLLEVEGPRLRPDLVLLELFVGNDLLDVLAGIQRTRIQDGFPVPGEGVIERWYRPLRPGHILPRQLEARGSAPGGLPIPFKGTLRRHSHAYRFLSSRMAALRRWWRTGAAAPREFTPFNEEAFFLRDYPPEFEEAWARVKASLREVKDWCRLQGASLAVVVVPTRSQVYPEMWEKVRRTYGLRQEDFVLDRPQAVLRDFGAETGIHVIDLLPAMRRARGGHGEELYHRTDIHWTAHGHAVAAEAILAELQSRRLLEASEGRGPRDRMPAAAAASLAAATHRQEGPPGE